MKHQHAYVCIDLKSFYASVECVERGLDPMTTPLVVADPERGDRTICLAVSPALKAMGVSNRCRVYEIPPNIEYLKAPPRMKKYIDYSAEIYGVYLRYLSPEDIHVYSIDEVFLDVTPYLSFYGLSPKEMAVMLMDEVLAETGIRATAGVGTNLYLAKIALDIMAKHAPDFIGILDEETYREKLWDYTPITDFWRIGRGTAQRLLRYGIKTMRNITEVNEELLYDEFGIDAELLIDHAWGKESVTMADIKNYRSKSNCLTSGQVLMRDYHFEEGRLILREMLDLLCLDLVEKKLITDSITFSVGYTYGNHQAPSGGSVKLDAPTNADHRIIPKVIAAYNRLIPRDCLIRRIHIYFNNVLPESQHSQEQTLFETADSQAEKNVRTQKAVIDIKRKYGKNAILKGMNFEEAATTRERNRQIGGHKSGE